MNESTEAPEVKPGYLSTEFWVAILSLLAPLATLVFHRDFTQEVQSLAIVAAGFVTAAYALGRAIVKAAHSSAAAQIRSASIRKTL